MITSTTFTPRSAPHIERMSDLGVQLQYNAMRESTRLALHCSHVLDETFKSGVPLNGAWLKGRSCLRRTLSWSSSKHIKEWESDKQGVFAATRDDEAEERQAMHIGCAAACERRAIRKVVQGEDSECLDVACNVNQREVWGANGEVRRERGSRADRGPRRKDTRTCRDAGKASGAVSGPIADEIAEVEIPRS
ncbi:hypothetical protein CONPUDRAFT_147584 [Coniophora puteana RWD-64-598 SS2]|uniref:Uncharacterized protein n=1 Tax=Coniophora puteana (strain RWD-64-598) TaxID=741705 RepID=R7SF74_CONPW|nr:uncharacterized protein CONPUDRAFT_147584 [Coniophora puteana RWD-64-598 SS2]EIW74530.1 hypothetical protein CONPUDRAFT_147584 [Coniophora puteana RWD-64-598 SS2]